MLDLKSRIRSVVAQLRGGNIVPLIIPLLVNPFLLSIILGFCVYSILAYLADAFIGKKRGLTYALFVGLIMAVVMTIISVGTSLLIFIPIVGILLVIAVWFAVLTFLWKYLIDTNWLWAGLLAVVSVIVLLVGVLVLLPFLLVALVLSVIFGWLLLAFLVMVVLAVIAFVWMRCKKSKVCRIRKFKEVG